MCHKKRKLTFVSGAKPGTEPRSQRAGSRTLFYSISIILQIFTKYSVKKSFILPPKISGFSFTYVIIKTIMLL